MGRNSNKKTLNSPYDLNDATILLVFLIMVVSIIFFYDGTNSQKTLQPSDRQAILDSLVTEGPEDGNGSTALVVGNSVDLTSLDKLSNTNYDQLKKIFGVKSEFVIYFEDENGNLILLGNKPCIGSSLAFVNGHRCNE